MKKYSALLFIFITSLLYSQWTQTINGVSIWSVAKDINGNVYAGSFTATSKLYKTTNNGLNWSELTGGNSQTIFGIAVDSMNNIFAANYSAGLLKSTSAGSNFTTMPISNFGNENPQAVACGKRGHVYVGTNGGGFYRSIDTGATFTFTGLAACQVISIAVDKYNSAIVYVGVTSASAGPNGFYRSTDHGASFSTNLNPNKNIYGILQKSPTLLYTTSTGSGDFDMSVNGGLNWSTVSTAHVGRGITDGDMPGDVYISGTGGAFYSINGGSTFTNDNLTYSANQIVKSGNYIFVATTGATNGGVWIRSFPLSIHTISNDIPENFSLEQNYPNPFNPTTKFSFQIPLLRGVSATGGRGVLTSLIIYDVLGSKVETIVNGYLSPGTYEANWNADNFSSGVYYYQLSSADFFKTKKIILIK